jgi:HK97 family phage portal protein
MKFIERARLAGKLLFKSAPAEQPLSLTNPAGWASNASYTGKAVNDTTAMQISTVWACVRLLAETIASVPGAVYERVGRNSEKRDDDPLTELLRQPNSDMSGTDFTEALVVNLGLRGNAFALKGTMGKRVRSLYPMPANLTTMRRDPKTQAIVYDFSDRGKTETYPREQVWHIKGFGSNGLMGFSPIECMRQAMGFNLAAEEVGGRAFANAAMPSVFVSIASWLEPEQRKIAKEKILSEYSGASNSGKPWLLEGGMTAEVQTPNLEDLQFLAARRFGVQEICRIYRVPPHMVADLDRATFNNIEQMSQDLLTYTFLPYWTRIESSALRWLIPEANKQTHFLRYNVEGLLRADTAARGQFYSMMLQNGAYSRNEVRALENRNPVEGLDDYTVQSNMLPVAQLSALVESMINAKLGKSAL